MTPKEIKAMRGTEFIYRDGSNHTIPAYIKQFDPAIGFSCYSLGTEVFDGDGNPTGQDNFPLMKPVDRTKSKSINPVVNLLQRYPLLEKLFLHPIFIRLLNLL